MARGVQDTNELGLVFYQIGITRSTKLNRPSVRHGPFDIYRHPYHFVLRIKKIEINEHHYLYLNSSSKKTT